MTNAVEMAKIQIRIKLDDSVSEENSLDRYSEIE